MTHAFTKHYQRLASIFLILLLSTGCSGRNQETNQSRQSKQSLAEDAFYQKNFKFIKEYSSTKYLFLLNQEVETALHRLGNYKCQHSSTVMIIDRLQPLAITTSQAQILLSSGLINRLQSAEELFFVLAHENAHIANCDLQDLGSSPRSLEQELSADLVATQLLLTTARPVSAAYSAINRLYEGPVNQITDIEYPSHVSRLKNLNQIPKNHNHISYQSKQRFLNFKQQVTTLSEFP